MSIEKILSKKLNQLNLLKGQLVTRSDKAKEEIIEEIKDTVEDLELILEDFNYIDNSRDINKTATRGEKEYTLEELEEYTDADGKAKYEVIDDVVYDVSELKRPAQEQKEIDEDPEVNLEINIKDEIECQEDKLTRGRLVSGISNRQFRDEILTKGRVMGWLRAY